MPPNAGKGRPKGVPNKATAERQAEIAATGQTPLEYLLGVMRDEGRESDERLKAATAAAPYVHPRLATVEVRDQTTTSVEAELTDSVTSEQAEARYLEWVGRRAPPIKRGNGGMN
jgi:hypothetical protein